MLYLRDVTKKVEAVVATGLFVVSITAGAASVAWSGESRSTATVVGVVDGDTFVVAGRTDVRLLQIDAPEVGSGECYSRKAARELRRLVPVGTAVRLRADPRLDDGDRYGRLLRYVFRGTTNVNVALVARGAATVWFYEGRRGRYARALLRAARRARAARRGLWGACRVVWNPYGPATSYRTNGRARSRDAACDGSYPGVCIPPPPPDLDCRDVRYAGFRVVGADPHRFDGDRDGVGCE